MANVSAEEGALGLNEHHENQIVQYMRFMRYQRGLRVRAIEACFEDLKHTRLTDTTYTKDEVATMLDELQTVLKGETETELMNAAHTNVLLLRQMCGQAEKWHLKLAINVSELESRELLDAIQNFEEQQFSLKSSRNKVNITVLKKLAPVEGGGAAPLLQAEIDRLRNENDMLKRNVGQIETKAVEFAEEKNKLAQQLVGVKSELGAAKGLGEKAKMTDAELAALNEKMSRMKNGLEQDLTKSLSAQQKTESELMATERKLLEVQQHLEMAEKELEKKFSQTGAYKNMKQMLNKKNEQLKQMRRNLAKYEPSGAADCDD